MSWLCAYFLYPVWINLCGLTEAKPDHRRTRTEIHRPMKILIETVHFKTKVRVKLMNTFQCYSILNFDINNHLVVGCCFINGKCVSSLCTIRNCYVNLILVMPENKSVFLTENWSKNDATPRVRISVNSSLDNTANVFSNLANQNCIIIIHNVPVRYTTFINIYHR